jgi:non-homologous end joining protein Ku
MPGSRSPARIKQVKVDADTGDEVANEDMIKG